MMSLQPTACLTSTEIFWRPLIENIGSDGVSEIPRFIPPINRASELRELIRLAEPCESVNRVSFYAATTPSRNRERIAHFIRHAFPTPESRGSRLGSGPWWSILHVGVTGLVELIGGQQDDR
jgi:hypothetical protein